MSIWVIQWSRDGITWHLGAYHAYRHEEDAQKFADQLNNSLGQAAKCTYRIREFVDEDLWGI